MVRTYQLKLLLLFFVFVECNTCKVTSQTRNALPAVGFANLNSPIHLVALSPDGKTLATAHDDNAIRCWDFAARRLIHTLPFHDHLISGIAFSPNGKILTSASWDNTVKLWTVASGRELATLKHGMHLHQISFSPDNNTLATVSSSPLDNKGAVRLWSVETKTEKAAVLDNWYDSVAFSPDGQTIAFGANGRAAYTVHIWDAGLKAEKARYTSQGSVHHLCFARDSKKLFVDSTKKSKPGDKPRAIGLVKVINAQNGEEVGELDSNTLWISSLVVSPDGKTLVSGHARGDVRLWDLPSGKMRGGFKHNSALANVVFSPDGKLLVSGDALGKIVVRSADDLLTPRELENEGKNAEQK